MPDRRLPIGQKENSLCALCASVVNKKIIVVHRNQLLGLAFTGSGTSPQQSLSKAIGLINWRQPMKPFQGVDYYRCDDLLTIEERSVRDTVRRWIDNKYMPTVSTTSTI